MPTDSATTRLLVWDEADMRASLDAVLVTTPARSPDVDLEAVYLWLADRCAGDQLAEACLFTTVEPGTEAEASSRITGIRTKGFGVVVRRAGTGAAEGLSGSLRAYVDRAVGERQVAEVLVASHDAGALQDRLEELASAGVEVTVLGFRERAGFAADSATLHFVDVEEVASAFPFPLPRTNLYDLPDEGLALPPLRRPAPGGSQSVPPAPVTRAPSGSPTDRSDGSPAAGEAGGGPGVDGSGESSGESSDAAGPAVPSSVGSSATYLDRSSIEAPAGPPPGIAGGDRPASPGTSTGAFQDWPGAASPASTEASPEGPAAGRSSGVGLFGRPSPVGRDDAPPPPPPPPPAPSSILPSTPPSSPSPTPSPSPSSIGALDDLLAGVQASPLTPPATRPGRVSPPTSESDDEDRAETDV
jgi:uncharacterized protein